MKLPGKTNGLTASSQAIALGVRAQSEHSLCLRPQDILRKIAPSEVLCLRRAPALPGGTWRDEPPRLATSSLAASPLSATGSAIPAGSASVPTGLGCVGSIGGACGFAGDWTILKVANVLLGPNVETGRPGESRDGRFRTLGRLTLRSSGTVDHSARNSLPAVRTEIRKFERLLRGGAKRPGVRLPCQMQEPRNLVVPMGTILCWMSRPRITLTLLWFSEARRRKAA